MHNIKQMCRNKFGVGKSVHSWFENAQEGNYCYKAFGLVKREKKEAVAGSAD